MSNMKLANNLFNTEDQPFLNRLININETISKDKFKQILRRFSKDINNFSFRAPMLANKHNDYRIYPCIIRTFFPLKQLRKLRCVLYTESIVLDTRPSLA